MSKEIILAFFCYFFILLAIGLASHKKQKNSSDFIVGSRSLNFWVIALSAHASDMSSWLFMAFPAAIFIRGGSQIWIAVGLLFGMLMTWQFVAKKLRTSTESYESYTLPSFFERRFNDKSGAIRITTALMSVIFLTCYLTAGLISMGYLLESIFSIDYYFGLTVATVVVVIYTFSGGFTTVAWTDLFQALFLLAVILIVPLKAYNALPNGFETIITSAQEKNVDLWPTINTKDSVITILFLIFGWGLGYFGQPHIVTKFMGIRNANELVKSKYVGMTWMLITLGAAAAVGFIGIGYFHGTKVQPELIFVEIVKELFHPFLGGIFLCGIIAATMSTMDSQILVAASVLSEDFYKRITKTPPSEKKLLLITRLSVVAISVIALLVAFNKSSTVLDAVQYAWSGLGCAFGPLLLMSLYSKKANKYGAVAGIIAGGTIAGTWDMLNDYITSYPVPAMIPGFILSCIAIYSVSLATQSCTSLQAEINNELT